jgi:hypothetical protein
VILRATPEGPIPSGVRPFDCPQRFFVLSRSRGAKKSKCPITGFEGPTEYVCDFTNFKAWPYGRCDCEDFNIRVESYMRRGEEPEKHTCWHIRRAVAFMAWHVELWSMEDIDE